MVTRSAPAPHPGPSDPRPPATRPVLGPPEPSDRFDHLRRRVGLPAGPMAAVAVYLLTGSLEPPQRALGAVLVLVIVLWITEAIPVPVTALLGLALAVATGVAPSADVFGSFSSPTIFLFIGSFLIARAMSLHGLDRRFAFRVLALPGVAASTPRIVIAFGLCAALLSSVISNTAAVAMLLPIGVGVLHVVDDLVAGGQAGRSRPRLAAALMLMLAYGASVGGLLTPIGSPPNLIGRTFIAELTGERLSFFDWMVTAAPIVALMFVLLCAVLLLLNRPEVRRLEGASEYFRRQRATLGPLSVGERNTMAAFGLAVTLWVLPGAVGLVAGESAAVSVLLRERLDEGTVAILAATLLFLLPVERGGRSTLSWEEAVRIDWGTIVLFGSGIALGTQLSETGLARIVGENLAGAFGVGSPLLLTLAATTAAVLMSEAASNTASVGIVVPVIIPIALAAGIDPFVPALAAVFGSSYGFMLPVSTPPNAIVYGSGLVPITRMVRSGALFDLLGIVLISGGLLLLNP